LEVGRKGRQAGGKERRRDRKRANKIGRRRK
jgi:general stress protein YciG